jgi:prevent-host-death family protein
MMEWQFADAKNRFDEVVNCALHDGPQRVHFRKDVVVVLSRRDYDQLHGGCGRFKDLLVG